MRAAGQAPEAPGLSGTLHSAWLKLGTNLSREVRTEETALPVGPGTHRSLKHLPHILEERMRRSWPAAQSARTCVPVYLLPDTKRDLQ